MAGGASADDDDIITDINVTPLVDIMLVLLIIFMLTANLIDNPAIEVDLPEASTGEASEPTTVGLVLTKDGTIYLNGSPTDEEPLFPTWSKKTPKPKRLSPPIRMFPTVKSSNSSILSGNWAFFDLLSISIPQPP